VAGAAPFTTSATASSALPVSFSVVSGPATATGANGSTITVTGAGAVVIRATQTGDSNFNAAPLLDQGFTVANPTAPPKASPTIVVPPVASALTVGQALSASTLSGGSASVAGTFIFTTPAITPNLGQSTALVTFVPNDTVGFNQVFLQVSVVVNPVGKAPVVTSSSSASGTVGTSFSYAILATENPTSFSASGLPAGLSFNPSTGVISGIPTAAGASALSVSATSAIGSGNATVALTIARANQSITFAPLAGSVLVNQPVSITATASSGLTTTLGVVSGNATLSGNSLTILSVGPVLLRASQAGDSNYNPATAELSLGAVDNPKTPQVYFGKIGPDDFAASIAPDGRSGSLFTLIAATGEPIVVNLAINPDGTFEVSIPSNLASFAASSGLESAGVRAAAPANRTFRGRVVNGVLSGTLVELGLTFSAAVQTPTGATTSVAGTYKANATASASGTTYVIIGTQGQAYALSVGAGTATAGTGSVSSAGAFQIKTAQGASISGTADATTTTVSGTVQTAGGSTIIIAGIGSGTTPTDRLVNLSSRGSFNGGDSNRVFIAGFVVAGSSPKQVLLRAVGPGLRGLGIQDPLNNPVLQLFGSKGQVLLQNSGWANSSEIAAAADRLGAFKFASGSQDSAILTTLSPGAYTMIVSSSSGNGITLAEVYDASMNPQIETQKLINISTRGFVDVGDGVMIAGFVVTGNSPKRVLIRAVGPGLTSLGVGGALADPSLAVYQSGAIIAQNDNWETPKPVNATQGAATGAEISTAAASAGAFALVPGSKDSAVVMTLAPGNYTAIVSGVAATSGVALVEVYEIP